MPVKTQGLCRSRKRGSRQIPKHPPGVSMPYFVKEVFYTIQGEGGNTGRPAVFLRFSGCNLWSGQEGDRGKGPGPCSNWCDTDFVGFDGPSGGKFESGADLACAVRSKWRSRSSRPFVVCTGGEPLLQLDGELVQ